MDTEQLFRTTASTRELATVLRDLSRAARAHSSVLKCQNHQARERATTLFAARPPHLLQALDPRASDLTGRISTAELVEILVDYHGWRSFAARLTLAVEMELEGVPPRVSQLEPALALDLFQRVLSRGPS